MWEASYKMQHESLNAGFIDNLLLVISWWQLSQNQSLTFSLFSILEHFEWFKLKHLSQSMPLDFPTFLLHVPHFHIFAACFFAHSNLIFSKHLEVTNCLIISMLTREWRTESGTPWYSLKSSWSMTICWWTPSRASDISPLINHDRVKVALSSSSRVLKDTKKQYWLKKEERKIFIMHEGANFEKPTYK